MDEETIQYINNRPENRNITMDDSGKEYVEGDIRFFEKHTAIGRQHLTGKLLVIMCGIRRTGNHVIRDWTEYQFPPPTHNCVNSFFDFYLGIASGYYKEPVTCRIVSIEEQLPRSVYIPHQYGHQDIKRVVILRDPYNTFASRIKVYQHDKYNYWNPEYITYLWLDYAKFFLSNPKDVILISYNEFLVNKEYRHNIFLDLGAAELDGVHDDTPLQNINPLSGGSSFDGTLFHANAQQMKVFDRWRYYVHDERYRKLFTPEIRELAKEIFNVEYF